MNESTGRPQDQGRRHRRQGQPGAATRALLERYQDAMRADLGALLDDLEPKAPPAGLLGPEAPKRPPVAERAKLWDLAVKLARELGGAIDDPDPAEGGADPLGEPTTPPRRRKVDYGGR